MKHTQEQYGKVLEYLEQWRHDEEWTDLNVALDRGDALYAAHLMAGTGAIDPDHCFEWAQESEKLVLAVAAEFQELSFTEQNSHVEDLYRDCFISACQECNANQFLDCGNENVYPEVKEKCWVCESTNIEAYYWTEKSAEREVV